MNWGSFWLGHAGHLLGLIGLLVGSAFFSGTETALFSLSRAQLQRLRQGGPAARLAAGLMGHPERTLNTLLLGNMLINVTYAALSATMVHDLAQAGARGPAVVAAIVPLLLLILVGEVSPKSVAYVYRSPWAVLAGGPTVLIQRLLQPLLWLFNALLISPLTRVLAPSRPAGGGVTADELTSLLDISAKRGLIDRDANELLQEIIELTDLRVSDIMVPRVDMVAFDLDRPRQELIELFKRSRLRKIPVFKGNSDHLLGVIYFRQLVLQASQDMEQLVVKVPFVPEAANLERLLVQFRATRTQMAIVVDEYGGTAGIVTLEDVLGEIVGQLPDPMEAAESAAVEPVGIGEYLIDGDLPIRDWADTFGVDLTEERISTIGGFFISRLGRIPEPGDSIEYRNLRFTVERMRRHRIAKLSLKIAGGHP